MPGGDWGEGLEFSFLEIAANAVSRLKLVDCPIGEALDTEYPGPGQDFTCCQVDAFFDPGVVLFQAEDFFFSCLLPLWQVVDISGRFVEGKGVGV